MTDRGPWIQTYTGRRFYPLAPREEDVCIRDIAHALAHIGRFGGHAKAFYSVAEHSVFCCRYAEPAYQRWALLHDAAEAYIGDMVRPLKHAMPQFIHIEGLVMAAITARFGLRLKQPDSVGIIDNCMLVTEAPVLLVPQPDGFKWWEEAHWAASGAVPYKDHHLECWRPQEAKHAFLVEFKRLWKGEEL